jgi:hypothetical protein
MHLRANNYTDEISDDGINQKLEQSNIPVARTKTCYLRNHSVVAKYSAASVSHIFRPRRT